MISNENLKEVINYLEENQAPVITEVAGQDFSNKRIYPIQKVQPETLTVATLGAAISYIKSNVDKYEGQFVINILDSRRVAVYTSLEPKTRQREHLLEVRTPDCRPTFCQWVGLQNFIIELRSRFVPTEHSAQILSALGNVKKEDGVQIKDDGFSQELTTKKGVSYEKEDLPNPVTLKPFRTFPEIEQPASEFVFRVDSDMECRLEEADGGIWRIVATKRIAEYLTENLEHELAEGKVIILA